MAHERELKGSCLCGAVQYVVEDRFKYAGYCHCSQCRKFSGSAFSAFGGVAEGDLSVVSGAERIGTFAKSDESLMCFCRVCGSSLFVRKPRIDMIHLRLGTLDDAPGIRPQGHVMVGSKAPWYEITDDLMRFEGKPPVYLVVLRRILRPLLIGGVVLVLGVIALWWLAY